MDLPRYYLVGSWERPVKVIETKNSGMTILAFDWDTGEFRQALIYGNTLFAGAEDVQRVSQSDFEEHVRNERRNLTPNKINVAARKSVVQQSQIWSQIDERMKQRLEEYEWEPARILSFLQSNILYDTLDKLYQGLSLMKQENKVVRFLDRFVNPLD